MAVWLRKIWSVTVIADARLTASMPKRGMRDASRYASRDGVYGPDDRIPRTDGQEERRQGRWNHSSDNGAWHTMPDTTRRPPSATRQRYQRRFGGDRARRTAFTVVPPTLDVQSRLQGLYAEGAFRIKPQASCWTMGRGANTMGTGIYLVRVLKRPAVDAVVRRVQAALGEPDDVARLEAS